MIKLLSIQYNEAATAAPAATVSPAFQIAPLRSAIYDGAATNVPYGSLV